MFRIYRNILFLWNQLRRLNETEHLEEMETREGNKYWIDRFLAKHLVILYYWIMVGYYVLDPLDAYDINMKIEKHAYETYIKYLSYLSLIHI